MSRMCVCMSTCVYDVCARVYDVCVCVRVCTMCVCVCVCVCVCMCISTAV